MTRSPAGEKVQAAIRTGRIPDRTPDRTWAGSSAGTSCAICRERIDVDDIEFELEFAGSDGGVPPEVYHVHRGCFWAWHSERESASVLVGDGAP